MIVYASEWAIHQAHNGFSDSLINLLLSTYTVLFTQVFNTDSNIIHLLDHICENFFHTAEVKQSGDKDNDGNNR